MPVCPPAPPNTFHLPRQPRALPLLYHFFLGGGEEDGGVCPGKQPGASLRVTAPRSEAHKGPPLLTPLHSRLSQGMGLVSGLDANMLAEYNETGTLPGQPAPSPPKETQKGGIQLFCGGCA